MAEDKYVTDDEDIDMPEEERVRLKKIIEKLMESGSFFVYGDEDKTEETVSFHGCERKKTCKSICCSFIFALTKEEVKKGTIKWNQKRPYFIAREKDGFCPHLDRKHLRCSIYNDRPKRCRKYHCEKDPTVWRDWDKGILNPDVFNHLPKKS
jgi:hypothetical protein